MIAIGEMRCNESVFGAVYLVIGIDRNGDPRCLKLYSHRPSFDVNETFSLFREYFESKRRVAPARRRGRVSR